MTQEEKSPIQWGEATYTNAEAAGLALAEGGYSLLFSIVDLDFGYGACYRAFVNILEGNVSMNDLEDYAGTNGIEITCDHTDLDQAKRDCEAWLETFARSLYNQL